ncbi:MULTISPECIES: hypothetical protein [Rhizobium/Agrobacterium group]|uniref:hypothetical protein n=1 Tax=Rhizobium/Agrobacterium group TaxID=227290 RepID=UPI001E3F6A50|nr:MULTISPECIES: hypothetical protein [Rhizobium/Agrobacterium group]
MPDIRFYQSRWATKSSHPERPELPVVERFDIIKSDGWHGMSIDLGALALDEAKATVPEFARTGLASLLTAFPTMIDELRPALRFAKDIGSPYVIVVGQVMPVKLEEMIPVIRQCHGHRGRHADPMQPITEQYQAMVRQILRQADSFQGRVATRNQVQVQIDFRSTRSGSIRSPTGGDMDWAIGSSGRRRMTR